MSHHVKVFGKMDRELQQEFYEFQNFNDFLESHPTIALDQIHASYLKILGESNFENNKGNYSELDFVVKQAMEESGVAVNKILEFVELKYQEKKKIVTLTFLNNLPFLGEYDEVFKMVESLFQDKKGGLRINVIGYGTLEILYDFTHQDFWESLDFLKNNIQSAVIKVFPEEKST